VANVTPAHGFDFVIATGDGRNLKEVVETAFAQVGIDWQLAD
jgi:GDP-D-mannose dehydratase